MHYQKFSNLKPTFRNFSKLFSSPISRRNYTTKFVNGRLFGNLSPLVLASSVGLIGLFTASYLTPSAPILCDSKESDDYLARLKLETIGNYENKLRSFSHPLKVFSYFASVTKNGEKLMTTHDFIRSLLPYKSHVNKYLLNEKGVIKRVQSAEDFFNLADMDGDGYINFDEYMIFLTLLGTPEYQWRLSFRLFDINGDGSLQKDEFQRFMHEHTAGLGIGARMGSHEKKYNLHQTGLFRLFFGENGNQALQIDDFLQFMKRLHLEQFYFNQFDVQNDTISLKEFGQAAISYASEKKLKSYLRKLLAFDDSNNQERITFQQFYDFDSMIKTRLHDVGMAYRFYKSAKPLDHNGAFAKSDFKRIIKAVTKLELTTGQVEVLFAIFDASGVYLFFYDFFEKLNTFLKKDGVLDSSEFYHTFKSRESRGLDSNRDTGFVDYFSRVWECVNQEK
ncbi:hypothetical protein HK096_000821 [Nowakowskiella sp. JEL0078]|nr:hypothetical protein HK096_000821 [Nowakowskiella sp. JEL0078]